MEKPVRIALTGFMGVGKSSVARHLAKKAKGRRIDLDGYIEKNTGRTIADILESDGEPAYRRIETDNLKLALGEEDLRILSLGGGTWTIEENRDLIKESGIVSVWLESTFEHCWQNIRRSRKARPLAQDREKALQLFQRRQALYCLADWHFIVRPDLTSYDIACQIAEEVLA